MWPVFLFIFKRFFKRKSGYYIISYDPIIDITVFNGTDKAISRAYSRGIVSEERLSYSVKKILKAKYKAGLNKYQPIDLSKLYSDLNTIEDEVLNYEAMGKALTLLKNENNLI